MVNELLVNRNSMYREKYISCHKDKRGDKSVTIMPASNSRQDDKEISQNVIDASGFDNDSEDYEDNIKCLSTSFFGMNLENLQEQCEEYHACAMELYKTENSNSFTTETYVKLDTFCGLLYSNKVDKHTLNKCSTVEQQALGLSIGEVLDRKLKQSPPSASATKLHQCIKRNAKKSEKYIDTICRLQMQVTTSYLCKNKSVHNLMETVINHELEHLHCSCNSLPAPTNSVLEKNSIHVGAACGASALITLILILIFLLCYRHRRRMRERVSQTSPTLPADYLTPIYTAGCLQVGPQGCNIGNDDEFRQADNPPAREVQSWREISRPTLNHALNDSSYDDSAYCVPLSYVNQGQKLPKREQTPAQHAFYINLEDLQRVEVSGDNMLQDQGKHTANIGQDE